MRVGQALMLGVLLVGCGAETPDNTTPSSGAGGAPSTASATSSGAGAGGQGGSGGGSICSQGDTRCSDLNVETCDENGAWQVTDTCSFVCIEGACTGECSPTSTQCDGLDVQTCGAAGSWQVTETCPYICDQGACTGDCSPGSSQCDGLDVQTCDAAGAWTTTATCPFVCDQGACTGVCSPGATKCDGQTPQTCDANGQWVDGTDCQFVCAAGACTGSCTPNDTICNGTTVQTCDQNGAWQNTQACPFVCQAGGCTGVCSPGATQCSGNSVQTCDANGQWVTGSSCPFVCQAGACTGVCTPGSTQCDGQTGTQTCNASGQWGATSACPTSANENPTCSGGVCGTTCQTGYDDCTGAPGCETDLSEPNTCGSCTNQCDSSGGTATCSGGMCGITCDAQHADCNMSATDGCEVDLGTTSNCLSCGDACTSPNNAVGVCEVGGCEFTCTGLWDDCNGLPGDGCEYDVSNDSLNCGGCGFSCLGGSCAGGTCQYDIEEVVVSPDSIGSIALDGSNIYWTAGGSGNPVRTVPKSGGTPTDLVAGYPDHSSVFVDTNGTDVVFSGYSIPNGWSAISNVPAAGGSTSLLATNTSQHFAVDDQHAYWTDQPGGSPCYCSGRTTTVYRVPLSGGAVEAWATIPFESRPQILVDATNVYVASHGFFNPQLQGPFGTCPSGTCSGNCNFQGENCPGDYEGRIYRINKVAATPSVLASCGPTSIDPFGCYSLRPPMGNLAVNDTHVFFVARPNDFNIDMFRVPVGGGTANWVSPWGAENMQMVADASYVYFISGNGLLRVPVNTGPEETIATNQTAPGAIRLDATHVYWKVAGYNAPGYGSQLGDAIFRAPK